MTRMIERWFPCKEVSENSERGWGSGNTERNLFTWFAARPTAQAKAAVICSLLAWPAEETEQARLQTLVRAAMTGRYAAWTELRSEILAANPGGCSVLDPFSGRGMIPLEAARLGLPSYAVDYSPVAVLASRLLTDFPFRDWSNEPRLPFHDPDIQQQQWTEGASQRLVDDIKRVLGEVGRRHGVAMDDLYPEVNGRRPWGYLWAVTLPCQECGRRFPLVGSFELRKATTRKGRRNTPAIPDPGQSFCFDVVEDAYHTVVHAGPPRRNPTLINAVDATGKKIAGKSAVCLFCSHVHPLSVHRRLTNEGLGQDLLIISADNDDSVGKLYRVPTTDEVAAAQSASSALAREPSFGPQLTAVPDEGIAPGNNNIIGPSIYGARTFGDLMCDRQTLSFVRLARVVTEVHRDVLKAGISSDYARALSSYVASAVVRKLRRSTRGATLSVARNGVDHIFVNEGSLSYSYDFFEAGLGEGPGTWSSIVGSTMTTINSLMADTNPNGYPTEVQHCSATSLPFRSGSFAVVVTDPPYDQMIAYADSSDLFFSWLKRVLHEADPSFGITSDPYGAQEKLDEIIVKRSRGLAKSVHTDHRTREHYDAKIAAAFAEMRRVVRNDGLVTIVFGHGDPEVWQRLLGAMTHAGLVMTGSWPARTEAGGQQGKANIETTLTMACRPAPPERPVGRKITVESELRAEVRSRVMLWEKSGLAPTDMLMAAAGPAMEVVGRYSAVLDARGEPVDISTFLPLARAAVQEAMAIEIDHHPLETFDARTRFALWWARLYGRQVIAKSELRWQALAASMDLDDVRDLVPDADKGSRLVGANEFNRPISPESSVVDVALAMAKASDDGLQGSGEVLLASGRDVDDAYLWAAMAFLADRLPDSDPDSISWTRLLRNRAGVGNAAKAVIDGRLAENSRAKERGEQIELF